MFNVELTSGQHGGTESTGPELPISPTLAARVAALVEPFPRATDLERTLPISTSSYASLPLSATQTPVDRVTEHFLQRSWSSLLLANMCDRDHSAKYPL